ncbi:uncharacterized protein F5891DRAFT_1036372 [Suillus fuscotomentosus]|uniref:Secreted protein n=1 Tax=Suillus fuscotomentosus TaxID=1912939 RepID=A0AAD4E553_9AGAM|nr:uncharacterized protein F5891DRAFT_1036372 [Suillus fuscotomentosus]KAG1899765.1 hypothetical protein F5891DRAFT_1036372 [Suillus fuscotomentosus]
MKFKSITTILILAATAGPVVAGLIAYAICQTAVSTFFSRLQRNRCCVLLCSRIYIRRRIACGPSRHYSLQCSPWGMYGSLRCNRAWTHSLSESIRECGEKNKHVQGL